MSQRVIYPLERRNGLLFVRVSVGTGVMPPVVARLLVDTGSSYTVLSTQILVRSGCEIPRSAGVDGLLDIDFLMLCDATIEVRRSQIVMGA